MTEQDIEARFVEQEHRIVHVVVNFLRYRSRDIPQPLRRAAAVAVGHTLFRIFIFPGGASVGLFGIILVLFQVQVAQNENKLIEIQNAIAKDSRRLHLVGMLYPSGASDVETNPRTRTYALLEYIRRERADGVPVVDLRYADLRGVDLRDFDLRNIDLTGADLSGCYFERVDMEGVSLRDANLIDSVFNECNLKEAELGLAIVASASFPYPPVDEDDLIGMGGSLGYRSVFIGYLNPDAADESAKHPIYMHDVVESANQTFGLVGSGDGNPHVWALARRFGYTSGMPPLWLDMQEYGYMQTLEDKNTSREYQIRITKRNVATEGTPGPAPMYFFGNQ
ncbi:MAG: pentapeptide repeat-containing protein [Phycisphaera sp.]|nr:MAG: pentapeptide repeat-containing protein [Phycisphaera sp.]